jgi:hypothetical protein
MYDPVLHIPRYCLKKRKDGSFEHSLLSAYRDDDAYVLLGEQGAGKSESFKYEAKETGGVYIKARDFIHGIYEDLTDKTIYIDGIDEIRSGNLDGRVPFDQVRKGLLKLGSPAFRLSCREADWYGSTDEESLKLITSGQKLNVLKLCPLDNDEIRQAVEFHVPEIDIDWFLNGLEKSGLDSLLGNPQLLIMLAKACSGNSIPESRLKAYDLACRQMILETNDEHLMGKEDLKFTTDDVLEYGGKLCAHILLADMEGLAQRSSRSDIYPAVSDIDSEALPLAQFTLKTRLFKSTSESEQREPVHRTVAEFLAARYLAKQIDEAGLPVGRVLALMSSLDQVVSSLRGLYGWLAVLSKTEQENLLRRDPLGIILYGDPKHLTRDKKLILIESLKREINKNPRFRNQDWKRYSFGALATQDMEKVFRCILSSELRTLEHQMLVDCIIDALHYGDYIPGLDKELLKLVKDKNWYSSIRRAALRMLLRDIDNTSLDQIDSYVLLANQFRDEILEDNDQDLLGTCLRFLYPEFIKPKEIFNYLMKWKDDHYIGVYHNFWVQNLLEKTHGDQLKILLDELVDRPELRKQMQNDYVYKRIVGKLLVNGLRKHGDSISIKRLYQWLGIGIDQYSNHLDRVDIKAIAEWIGKRSEVYKQLLIEGANKCDTNVGNYNTCLFKVEKCLYGADRPEFFSQWLLGVAQSSKNVRFSEYCFREVMRIFYSGENRDMKLDQLLDWLENNEKFKLIYKEMSVDNNVEDRIKSAKLYNDTSNERKKRKETWLEFLIENKNKLENGLAQPSIFEDLGMAYFGYLHDAPGETPEERLSNLFTEKHSYMVGLALKGFSAVLRRKDLPSAKEVLDLKKENRRFYLEFPVLAGMDYLFNTGQLKLQGLADSQVETAITFYLVHHASRGGDDWLYYLFNTKPDLVAKIYTQYATYMLKTKQHHIFGSYACAYIGEWANISKLTVINILEKFPLRASVEQSSDLEYFLKAALRFSDSNELFDLVRRKLNRKSLDDSQRVMWMAVALILDASQYENIVNDFISKSSKRVLTIAGFFSDRMEQWMPDFNLTSSSLAMLVRNLAVHVSPYSLKSGRVTREMNAADLVGTLISKMAESTEISAIFEFEKLVENPDLSRWHTTLRDRLYELRKRINESEFIKPTLSGVVNTLQNRAPANPSDLIALSLDLLHDQSNKIRNDSNNLFMQFWNFPGKKTGATPKSENECRDILKSQIEPRFQQLNLQLVKEGYYVEDKRADLKVLFGDWNLPIEIKKEDYSKNANDNIWTSLWNQLIKKYTRDPQAYGYGIYLIFWFGKGKVRVSPNGRKPTSAKEMEEMLLGMMSDDERKRIGLCVIDCSLPY